MTTKTKSFPEGTKEKMKELLKRARTANEAKKILCILLKCQGKNSSEIEEILNWRAKSIRRIWSKYHKYGDKYIVENNRKAKRNKAYLNLEEEKDFLKPFIDSAKEGKILIITPIQKALEKKLGKPIRKSVVYEMLHRHGWRKIAPRPSHPKTNLKKQEDFKENIFPPQDKRGKRKSRETGIEIKSNV